MGRAPCCDKANVKKGPWSPEEDAKLKQFIEKSGTGGNWIALPQKAGLKRCGKSCRLRWLNYLRPNIKHGEFSEEEDRIICSMYSTIGSRWSIIAAQLPGRTDNDIKNYWNTKLKKKLMDLIQTSNQRKILPHFSTSSQLLPIPPQSYYSQTLISQNLLSNNTGSFSFPTNNLCFQMKENHNMLRFGGNEPSCSSSDGSCSQMSYGKEIKQENMAYNISNCIGRVEMKDSRVINEENIVESKDVALVYDQMTRINAYEQTLDHTNNGVSVSFGKPQLECDLDEVKELISSNYNNSFDYFMNDENKYYYY